MSMTEPHPWDDEIDMHTSIPNESQQLEETQGLYVSQAVQDLAPDARPNPSTVCETCPQSTWFTTETSAKKLTLKCFCQTMNAIVWKLGAEPVTTCDGREMAYLRMAQKERRRQERSEAKALAQAEKQAKAKARAQEKAAQEADKQARAEAKAMAKAAKEAEKLDKAAAGAA